MKVSTQNMISITEANQNFSRVARMVDEQGPVIVLKNNTPKYLIIEFNSCLLYTSPSPRDSTLSRMPSSA